MSAASDIADLFAHGFEPSLGLIAAHIAQLDPDAPPVDTIIRSLDTLANAAGEVLSADDLMTHLFGTLGFRGNAEQYYDESNSLLHVVLATRRGIPISLSVVAIEVGRRLGIGLDPIGMPAHFLVAHGHGDNRRWFDPMSGGRSLDFDEVCGLFGQLLPDVEFQDEFLLPVSSADVATRMLNNLRSIHFRKGDLRRLSDVVAAQVELPNAPLATRVEHAQLLASRGQYQPAIEQLELLIELDPDQAEKYQGSANRLRTHFN